MTLKGARLTQRDAKLLRLLFDYGVISSGQISSWLFQGVEKTTVLRRLRRLEEGDFIRKRGTLPDGTAVFLIDHMGIKELGERTPITTFPAHLLIHEVQINSIRWTLERLQTVKTWMTERTLRSEIMRRNPGRDRPNLVVPDALILFRNFLTPSAKVEFEMELHPKSLQRYRSKFEKFDPTRQKSNSFHWYLVPNNSFGRNLLHLAKKHGGYQAEKYIGFSVIPEFWEQRLGARLFLTEKALPLHDVLSVPYENWPALGSAQGVSIPKLSESKPMAF